MKNVQEDTKDRPRPIKPTERPTPPGLDAE
jgi:hypothetical protein